VKLYSRRGNSFTNIYPQVVDASRGPAGKIIYSRWRISSS
jgi:hypothetical protein